MKTPNKPHRVEVSLTSRQNTDLLRVVQHFGTSMSSELREALNNHLEARLRSVEAREAKPHRKSKADLLRERYEEVCAGYASKAVPVEDAYEKVLSLRREARASRLCNEETEHIVYPMPKGLVAERNFKFELDNLHFDTDD